MQKICKYMHLPHEFTSIAYICKNMQKICKICKHEIYMHNMHSPLCWCHRIVQQNHVWFLGSRYTQYHWPDIGNLWLAWRAGDSDSSSMIRGLGTQTRGGTSGDHRWPAPGPSDAKLKAQIAKLTQNVTTFGHHTIHGIITEPDAQARRAGLNLNFQVK